MNHNGFTPIQRKMLAVLSDGKPHLRQELHACLMDELGSMNNISAHLTAIRRRLRLRSENIICHISRDKIYYQHVKVQPITRLKTP